MSAKAAGLQRIQIAFKCFSFNEKLLVDNLIAIHLVISLAFGRIFEKPLLGVSAVYTVAVWAEQLHGPC